MLGCLCRLGSPADLRENGQSRQDLALDHVAIPTNSYASIHADYLAAIEWMKALGIKLELGRTIHYEKVLRRWKDAYLSASDAQGREVFPDFVSSVAEIAEFVNIHKAFQNVPVAQLSVIADKLRRGVNGPIAAVDETPDSTAARNFLFEAGVAARAHHPEQGVEAILDARIDTGIRVGRSKIWVECKRVTSLGKLEQNVRKACAQLETHLGAQIGSGHRGMIAIDITKIINRGDQLFVSRNDQELIDSTQRMLDDFIRSHAELWQRIYASKNRKIIGTIFRLTFMATSEARRLLVHTTQWALSPRADVQQADFDVQTRLVESLQASL